jgi:uncharacterized LabA/DUF88 family protein
MENEKEIKINIYIDNANLYRGAKVLGYKIDFKEFIHWLKQKYKPEKVYMFLGYVDAYQEFYQNLTNYNYILVFKPVSYVVGQTKGNCDAEMVLKIISDFYEKEYDKCIIITGDGDFSCIIEFLKERGALEKIIAPSEKRTSFLIINKNIEILFLDEHYGKFSEQIDNI